MSFLKVTNPEKRDQIVKEYLATKKRIQDSQLAEKTGEIELQTDLSKFFRPITETQKTTAKEITEGLRPIKEGIENLPAIGAYSTAEEERKALEEKIINYGPNAVYYLTGYLNKHPNVDRTFGIITKGKDYMIGNKKIDISGNNIIIDDKEYEGTRGLWDLIVNKTPNKSLITVDDKKKIEEIMIKTNSIFRYNDPEKGVKSSGGDKYKDYIKPIYDKIKEKKTTSGKGTVVIPSDPNALLERFDLLMSSKKAGHTGVRNEIISICDELKRQGIIDLNAYKNIMSIL